MRFTIVTDNFTLTHMTLMPENQSEEDQVEALVRIFQFQKVKYFHVESGPTPGVQVVLGRREELNSATRNSSSLFCPFCGHMHVSGFQYLGTQGGMTLYTCAACKRDFRFALPAR